ncbi:PP2C family protein-serine/threonine phosphatase [Pseudonocardia petroleophila]|uniref:Serine/threonine-protein phosphatase n=1 Tax=Pseudonocardia petroleophila TaxID=37331 RepID=A0A7G7MH20_9PSEU|nr:PP2C family protein-serine/threonine phosphatase [Pseudonocardia petroleophila]QNG52081.1 serine/threonine-protein phosphatase [Pseudonocardia petroleophila]
MEPDSITTAMWIETLTRVIDGGHLARGEDLSGLIDLAARPLGLRVELLMVDLAQQSLIPVRTESRPPVGIAGTMGGRAFQLGEILPCLDDGMRTLWVPVLDGTDRAGVMRVGIGDLRDDGDLRRRLWTLAGLAGHLLMTKLAYSDRLRRLRSNGPLSLASELLWHLLPPRTFATERVVVAALLEPHAQVAGDAYDYNIDGDMIDLAVFDSLGHDIRAALTSTLAITAVRNARRDGETDLEVIAARADEAILSQSGPRQFATAVLARFNTSDGALEYLLAGHPPPLLVRHNRVVKELVTTPRLPLGLQIPGVPLPVVGREQLEPGDRLLLYSDGIVEARDGDGAFFGEARLVELTERAEADDLSAPETLRRLGAAVLAHQGGELQDDATLVMLDWSDRGHLRLFPSSTSESEPPMDIRDSPTER